LGWYATLHVSNTPTLITEEGLPLVRSYNLNRTEKNGREEKRREGRSAVRPRDKKEDRRRKKDDEMQTE
jgi:hypothetical protein